jgi:hypothetical protein
MKPKLVQIEILRNTILFRKIISMFQKTLLLGLINTNKQIKTVKPS